MGTTILNGGNMEKTITETITGQKYIPAELIIIDTLAKIKVIGQFRTRDRLWYANLRRGKWTLNGNYQTVYGK